MAPAKHPDIKQLARDISRIENQSPGFEDLLFHAGGEGAIVIGITGAPGSGKSTLSDVLIEALTASGSNVAVLCVDPSSPFNRGALLGDRIRMNRWYDHPGVFIRSLASRGSLGGLHPHIIEITEYVRHAWFDYVIIETVGVGQSEVDIAALADTTVVVLVPEGGDSIQSMKSGLMEIADVFVVNKSDRPGADVFYHNLKKMIGPDFKKQQRPAPVFLVSATEGRGTDRLYQYLITFRREAMPAERKELLAMKAFSLLQSEMMKKVDEKAFRNALFTAMEQGHVNIYRFVKSFAKNISERPAT